MRLATGKLPTLGQRCHLPIVEPHQGWHLARLSKNQRTPTVHTIRSLSKHAEVDGHCPMLLGRVHLWESTEIHRPLVSTLVNQRNVPLSVVHTFSTKSLVSIVQLFDDSSRYGDCYQDIFAF